MPAGSAIVDADPLSDPRWDAFVRAHPAASGHHLGAWASILRDCYGYRPRYLALEEAGLLTGVFPLMSSGLRLTGSRLSSLPTAKAAGPLATTREGERELLNAAGELKRREKFNSLLVRSDHPDLQGDLVGLAGTHPTYVLELCEPAMLLERYSRDSKNISRSIRKAQKSGLVVGESNSQADLKDWYRLYLATIRKHRNLPRRFRQLQASMALLDSSWRFIPVHKDGRVIAGAIFHDIGETVELIYNASDPAYLSLRPNHAIYWHMISDAAERNRSFFDFGTADTDTLASFKEGWGAIPRDISLYVGDHRAEPTMAAATNTEAGARRRAIVDPKLLARKVIGASPLPVTRALGALVYRLV
jgi:hypothetical protein